MIQKIPYVGNISMLWLTNRKKNIKNDKIPKKIECIDILYDKEINYFWIQIKFIMCSYL